MAETDRPRARRTGETWVVIRDHLDRYGAWISGSRSGRMEIHREHQPSARCSISSAGGTRIFLCLEREKINGAVRNVQERAASRAGRKVRLLHGTGLPGEKSQGPDH